MKRIYIGIEGGIVTGVCTDDPSLVGLSVGIIDYDTDEVCEDEIERLVTFEQGGDKVQGFVSGEAVELASFDLSPAHDKLID